jgi:head-tail adaptor
VSITTLMVHDVVLVRATTAESRYGDDVKDWSDTTRTDSKGWVAQRARTEDVDGREAQVHDHVVYLPAGTDVTGLDRVEWDDRTFEVVGPVNRAWSPLRRGEHHVELDVRLVEG